MCKTLLGENARFGIHALLYCSLAKVMAKPLPLFVPGCETEREFPSVLSGEFPFATRNTPSGGYVLGVQCACGGVALTARALHNHCMAAKQMLSKGVVLRCPHRGCGYVPKISQRKADVHFASMVQALQRHVAKAGIHLAHRENDECDICLKLEGGGAPVSDIFCDNPLFPGSKRVLVWDVLPPLREFIKQRLRGKSHCGALGNLVYSPEETFAALPAVHDRIVLYSGNSPEPKPESPRRTDPLGLELPRTLHRCGDGSDTSARFVPLCNPSCSSPQVPTPPPSPFESVEPFPPAPSPTTDSSGYVLPLLFPGLPRAVVDDDPPSPATLCLAVPEISEEYMTLCFLEETIVTNVRKIFSGARDSIVDNANKKRQRAEVAERQDDLADHKQRKMHNRSRQDHKAKKSRLLSAP